MLRVYFLQQWYGLADEALEDALYDSQALQVPCQHRPASGGVPDATTLLNFRHLLETHDLCIGLLSAINVELAARGLRCAPARWWMPTLIAAPPSTQNQAKQRDSEMHQTNKGNQWYSGMKAHIGADRDSKVVPTAVVAKAAQLLHGQVTQVYADAGYTGVEKRAEIEALAEGSEKEASKAVEKAKASVRAFVEHPFHIVKNLFGYRNVRYRGLAKNGHQLYVLFELANVVIGARVRAAA